MADLADRITDAGFTPGLWLAPFIALPAVAEKNPALFLPGPAGYNWGGTFQALDLTRPAAKEFLAEMVHRVVHDWGYRYLKLDFLYAGALAAERRHGIGRERAYRDGLAVIREAAGEGVYLLGCGAMLLPSLGLLDGIRVGPDVAPMWEHYATTDPSDALARNALITTLHRLWQRPLIDIDPDVVYFRQRQNLLTEHQLTLLQDLALLCGFQATSDPPGWLTGGEREQLVDFLEKDPPIERISRYRFLIDGREVDFGPAALATSAQACPIGE
jgi:alpha-galactosidase